MSFEMKYPKRAEGSIRAENADLSRELMQKANSIPPVPITPVAAVPEEAPAKQEFDFFAEPPAADIPVQEMEAEPTETLVQETQISKPQQQAVAQSQQQETQREMNMRKAWEKAERAERERDELLRRLQQAEMLNQQKAAPQAPEEDLDINLGNDDIAEGKHLSKIDKKIKKLENLIKQQNQYTAEATAEARLKAQYPDFDKVVSKANLEMLQYTEPELAHTLNATTDIYAKAVSAYKLIKKLGIAPEQEDPYALDKARIQKNAAKPRTLSSVSPQQGSSPLQQANVFANGLTDELKAQLYKEMTAARRGM